MGFSPVPEGQAEVLEFPLASLCGSPAPRLMQHRPPWNGWSGARRHVLWERVSAVVVLVIRTRNFSWKKMSQGMT